MGIFSRDLDEEYELDMEDRSMFNREDKADWLRRRERAEEISSGLASGLFEKDEKVWAGVRKIEEAK